MRGNGVYLRTSGEILGVSTCPVLCAPVRGYAVGVATRLVPRLAKLEEEYRHEMMDEEEERGELYDEIVKLRRRLNLA